MKGNMYLAWSSDDKILKMGASGGAVTALLKFALEMKIVDAALAVKKRNGNMQYLQLLLQRNCSMKYLKN